MPIFWASPIASNLKKIGIWSDIFGVQKPGNEFGPKVAFLDSLGQRTLLRIVLHDEKEKPLADKKYKLVIEGMLYEDITAEDGLLEQEIPGDAERGELTVWVDEGALGAAYTWPLSIGSLDPVETIAGVQARLNNLSFDCGVVDGIYGPKTEAAIKAYQEKYELTVDGIPGPKTQTKLKGSYGC